MIGNQVDAALALSGDIPTHDYGTDRLVYLLGNVIYKVNINTSGGYNANKIEYEAYSSYSKISLPKSISLPATSLFHIDGEDIIAMEYVDGIETGECSSRWTGLPDCEDYGGCLNDDIVDALNLVGMNDLAWGNVITRNGRHYLIDMGDAHYSSARLTV